jgi:2,3,4,5-tetrahydropyridine-2-carboxylate N-succinyltransferase/tetrahydrodipicolinate N-acetyltransferase
MNAQELISYIANSEKKTPVKLYIKEKAPIDYGDARVFGAGDKMCSATGPAWAPSSRATVIASRIS